MVHRKVGIKADHLKPETRLENQLIKPSCSSQYLQQAINTAADFKKKMNKFKLVQLSDHTESESSRSSRPALPGKPPPAIPTKQSHENQPNYMKPTSSSDARKVISTQTRSCSNNYKIANKRSTKRTSASSNKTETNLTRSSSLKSVRTLTKAPSFKPSRGRGRASSTSKCSKMALSANIDMQKKATCSSTLKDSKFPNYLALHPGGTESQGTSVTRVCTYAYCSLNGHHRPPLPPLKIFLKAKRRSMKTHKGIKKMEACRAKLLGGEAKEDSPEQETIIDEKPAYKEADADMDFYVEMYEGQVAESLSDGSPLSEIDFEQKAEDVEEEHGLSLAREDSTLGSFWFGIDLEGEFQVERDPTDMEWDEGEFSVSEIAEEVPDLVQIENLSDLEVGFLPKLGNPEDVVTDEVVQEVIEDESGCFEIQFDDSDFEADQGSHQNHEKATQASNNEESENCPATSDAPDEDNIVALKQEETETHQRDSEQEFAKNEIGEDNGIQVSSSTQSSSDVDQDTAKVDGDVEIVTKENSSSQVTKEVVEDESGCFERQFDESDLEADQGIHQNHENATQVSNKEESENCQAGNQTSDAPDEDDIVTLKQEEMETNQRHSEQELAIVDAGDGMEAKGEIEIVTKESSSSQVTPDDTFPAEQARASVGQDLVEDDQVIEDQIPGSECCAGEVEEMEAQDSEKLFPAANSNTSIEENAIEGSSNRKWRIGCKKAIEDCEEQGEFNPREPNYLPLVPDPEAEKVDLRHQMMDERKNADEWMLDYALRQTVTKLAPARKKKVALLVEAFEKVLPVPKYKPPTRHHSVAPFTHTRPIQACK